MTPYYNPQNPQQTLTETLTTLYQKVRHYYPTMPTTPPTLTLTKRGYTSIARAYHREHRIDVNTNFFYSKNFASQLNTILLHELAHLVTHAVYHAYGQTGIFRTVCTTLGIAYGHAINVGTPENKPVSAHYVLTCPCGCKYTVKRKSTIDRYMSGRYRCSDCNRRVDENCKIVRIVS